MPTEDSLFSRRDILRLSALLTASGALPFLNARAARAQDPNEPVKIGYLPITDATPLLVAHGKGFFEAEGLRAEKPVLFRGWSQIVEAFLAGQVNVVHLLSPITVWARYGSKTPAKVVAWNHTSGSGLTAANNINSVAELGGKTVAIPYWYSIHNVVLQKLLRENRLKVVTSGKPAADEVNLVLMAPSDMVPALASGQIAGYIVAEPFNAAAEINGVGKVLRFTGDVWKDHACCLVFMHEQDLTGRPEWSQKVVNAMVKAQLWTRDNRAETAQLLSSANAQKYTPHSPEILARVLTPAEGDIAGYVSSGAIRHPEWRDRRIDFQPYPFPSYTEELVRMLKDTQVAGERGFLDALDPAFVASDLVDDRFVKRALADIGGLPAFGLADAWTRQEVLQA
ncbi:MULTISPECIES: ABC transporter substrate-binding protein [Agrobacterium tumefaciens complex]|jgi:NitT/TauT family transport system substrate-binding protein|uniref:ABC transporter substrate-binding protein n=1 Tax=Agrobacterium tumefaciens TaxID=358 RepID=UPI000FE29CB5|nr:ABC transporter substrate-binding protein [Agrobacterium tumefaciens]QAB00898.1 ABC transporter substrate-binding protein [Agrobacterium tumefaciens]